jgi:hypothetical protein
MASYRLDIVSGVANSASLQNLLLQKSSRQSAVAEWPAFDDSLGALNIIGAKAHEGCSEVRTKSVICNL